MSDAAVRAAIVLLVSTFLDDGVRELQTFGDQCRYLESSANHILLPRPLSALYVIASMVVQLGGGSYLLASALLSPSALGLPVLGGWPHVRRCTAALVAFVLSSLLVYGLGQPASQHAQGRLVFLLRNGGILGGLLLLLAAQQTTAARRRGLRLLARVCLALHGLELAPADSMAIVWLVDMLCLPLTVALFAGLHTSRVALALAALLVASDLSLNHFWSGTRYNDNIRYYFFEDLSLVGGLLLLAFVRTDEPDIGLDACRAEREMQGRGGERRALLREDGEAEPEEWDVE